MSQIPPDYLATIKKAASIAGVELAAEPLIDSGYAEFCCVQVVKNGSSIRLTLPVTTLDDIELMVAELKPWAPGAIRTGPVEIVITTPHPKAQAVAVWRNNLDTSPDREAKRIERLKRS